MTLATPAAARAARHRTTAYAIAMGVADVRGAPDGRAELVTQALLGARAEVLETAANGWARVRLADYEGWVESAHLVAPARLRERVAVIAVPSATLYARATGVAARGEVFATTMLPLAHDLDDPGAPPTSRTRVALPGGRYAWLAPGMFDERPASEPFPARGVAAALELARDLLGTPYLWGGVTARGIDCSGLTQLACREGGVTIPRDADEQYAALPYVVDRGGVRAGDLLYFAGRGRITHVGLALDNMLLLHANGYTHSVAITSLDPADGGYSADLAGWYAGARRPFLDAPEAGAGSEAGK